MTENRFLDSALGHPPARPLYQSMKAERGELLRSLRALDKTLSPAQRAPLQIFLGADPGLSKARRATFQESFLLHLQAHGLDTGPDWLAQQRAMYATTLEVQAHFEKETAQRARAKAERAQERHQAIQSAMASGQPVPAKYRRPGGRCGLCWRPLRDPESVRLGIGPECRKLFRCAP